MLFNQINLRKTRNIHSLKEITRELSSDKLVIYDAFTANQKEKPKQRLLAKGERINPFKLKSKIRKKRNIKKKSFRKLRPFRKPRRTLFQIKEKVAQRFKISKLKLALFLFIVKDVMPINFNKTC